MRSTTALLYAVLLTLGLLLFAGCSGDEEEATPPPPRPTVPNEPPPSPKPIATVSLPGQGLGDIRAGDDALWIGHSAGVSRIDPASNSVTATVKLRDAYFLDVDDRAVWISDLRGRAVRRVDPKTARVVATIRVGGEPRGIVSAFGAVWVADSRGGRIVRIDPEQNRVVGTVSVARPGGSGPLALAAGAGSVWVGVPRAQAVVRIDPRRLRVLAKITIPAPAKPCGGIVAEKAAVWLAGCRGVTSVARVDPKTNKAAGTAFVGGDAGMPLLARRTPWFPVELPSAGSQSAQVKLIAVDPAGLEAYAVAPVGEGSAASAAVLVFGSIWVTVGESSVARFPPGILRPR